MALHSPGMISIASDRTPANCLDAYARRRDVRRVAAARLGRVDGRRSAARCICCGDSGSRWSASKADRLSGALAAGCRRPPFWLWWPSMTASSAGASGPSARCASMTRGLPASRTAPRPGTGAAGASATRRIPTRSISISSAPARLFERLSTARTSMGEETLAAWLTGPGPPGRGAVASRRSRARAAARSERGPGGDSGWTQRRREPEDPGRVGGRAAPPLPAGLPGGLGGARVVSALLGVALTATLLAWLSGKACVDQLVGAAVAGRRLGDPAARAHPVGAVRRGHRAGELKLVAALLARLEREPFETPLAGAAAARAGVRGAGRGGRLAAVAAGRAAGPPGRPARRAPQPALRDPAPRCCSGRRRSRSRSRPGARVRAARWRAGSAAVGEIEALASLAAYAYEHPDAAVPRPSARRAALRGGGARPSAAPGTRCVANDVALGGAHPRLLDRQRLEHVGQEHAAAHRRRQRRAGAGRRAGARAAAAPLAARGRRVRCASRTRCRRARRASTPRSPGCEQIVDLADGPRPGAVPARRDPARHQLARPPHRRRGGRARPGRRAARSASSPPTTSRWPQIADGLGAARRATSTSRTTSRTARCASTTACGPAS